MGLFRNKKNERTVIKIMESGNESFYSWDGKLYKSDIVRSCIKPKVTAIGKLNGKHVKITEHGKVATDESANIFFLLKEPNPLMTAQQFQEKVANQFCLNNNAFILKVRNENGVVTQLYPIPCVMVEATKRENELYYTFTLRKGKRLNVPLDDVMHLKTDYYEDEIFGESPAPALADLMDMVGTIDQGIIKAIKNGAAIRWLLKFTKSLRPEDIKENVKEFVKNYMAYDTDAFGAAGVDAKADAVRIEPKDYVPNAVVQSNTFKRVMSFFGTNEKIIMSNWTEDEWNAFYEAQIEPFAIQMGQVYTIGLFKRSERKTNEIIFEASNLACASMSTKLNFVQMVDRGAMTPNEWRSVFNMAPIEGGDKPIRRLDTQVVNLIEKMLDQMNNTNQVQIADCIRSLLNVTERREENSETQGKCERGNHSE